MPVEFFAPSAAIDRLLAAATDAGLALFWVRNQADFGQLPRA